MIVSVQHQGTDQPRGLEGCGEKPMSGHAAAVLDAIERAEARRGAARHVPHFYVPMPDGRCNVCALGQAALGHFAWASLSFVRRHHGFATAVPERS
jgi:hypothetical protein